jgi:peptidoglycan hydrolase-like protein with peptidoglycan-binding domain
MKAVVAYQNAHGLSPSGMVDQALFAQIITGKATPKPKAEKKPAEKKPAAKKPPAKKAPAKKATTKKPSVTT